MGFSWKDFQPSPLLLIMFGWVGQSTCFFSINQRVALANLLLSGMILGYEQSSDERFFHLLRSFRKERFPGTAEILLSRGISPNCLRFLAQANLRPPHLLIFSSPHPQQFPHPSISFLQLPTIIYRETHISCLMHVK